MKTYNKTYTTLQKIINNHSNITIKNNCYITPNNKIRIKAKKDRILGIEKVTETNLIAQLVSDKNPLINSNIDTTNLYNKSFQSMFKNYNFIKTPVNINYLNTKNIVNFMNIFLNSTFSNDIDISQWDISNVENMNKGFEQSKNNKQNLSNWIFEKMNFMDNTFANITDFQIRIENIYLPNIQTFKECFLNSNQNINFNTWKFKIKFATSHCIMKMFFNCKKQTNTFKHWNLTEIGSSFGIFYNNLKLEKNTANWYNINPNNTFGYAAFASDMQHKNIISYIKKYVKTTGRINDWKDYIKFYLGQNQSNTLKLKYKKEYNKWVSQI